MKKIVILLCFAIFCLTNQVKADHHGGPGNNGVYQATGIVNLVGASLNTLNALIGQPTVVVSQPVYTTQVVQPVQVISTPTVVTPVYQAPTVVYQYPVQVYTPAPNYIYYPPVRQCNPYPRYYGNPPNGHHGGGYGPPGQRPHR